MIDTEQFQHTVHRFIELYGDRTEAIGDEVHAGLAWVDDTKFVLIGRGETVLFQPPSWRRISRLFDLAQHLRRPVLLWDILIQAEVAGPTTTLLHRRSAQNSRLHLLKLPVPIIGVFDRSALQPNLAVVDAAVFLELPDEDSHSPEGDAASTLIRVTHDPSDLRSDILELLDHLSTVPAETLINQRFASVRETVSVQK